MQFNFGIEDVVCETKIKHQLIAFSSIVVAFQTSEQIQHFCHSVKISSLSTSLSWPGLKSTASIFFHKKNSAFRFQMVFQPSFQKSLLKSPEFSK